MEPLLEVKKLDKLFYKADKSIHAVKDVSFMLQRGEILGIVGESGCGKSTIARLLTRLQQQDGGEIYLEGSNITNAKRREYKQIYQKIQVIFQNPMDSFNPRWTLGSAIMESMINKGISKKIAQERMYQLLESCGLGIEFASRFPHEVSGGECQRAAIARALAVRPKLIICDEATSALDMTVQKQIIELLIKLQKDEGLTILFICHDLGLVWQLCNRVLVMFEGSIIEEGTPDEILFQPKAEYTKMLLDASYNLG
jgi:oligopeptide transport system ATP-binding protein